MANTLKFGNGNWATKEGSALAYNDENNNFKPLPFDFSRASKATVINKDGLIEEVGSGQPRIDYKDDSKGAMLLEPQRSNLITYNQELDNASGWINQLGGTVVGGQIGVGNSLSAWKLNKGTGTFKSLRFQSSLSSANYTLSWYLKKGSLDIAEFRFDGGLGAQFIDFNLSTGVAGTNNDLTNIKMELINNDWYRCQASYNSTITNVHLYIGDASSTMQEGYVYAQAPQLEVGSYATSLINTQGSTVTRLAETCSQTTPDGVIGQTEGSIFAEYYFDATIDNSGGSDRDIVNINDGTFNNNIQLIHYGNGSGSAYKKVYLSVRLSGSYVITITSNQYSSGLMKVACGYKNNDYVLYVNGVQIGTNTSAGVSAMSRVMIGRNFFNNTHTTTKINETKLYNTRLSNSELQALTQV